MSDGALDSMCVMGAPTDEYGVCVEHGETACVIAIPAQRPPVD